MRMNISVPDELKRRMDRIEGVNWSALACAGFTERVNALEREKKGSSMKNTIERLRLSKQKGDDEDTVDGRAAGRAWASDHAEAKELERLAAARDPIHDWYIGVGSSAFSDAEHIYFKIAEVERGVESFSRRAAEEFWETVLGDNQKRAESEAFVQGFAEGACEVWEEIKDQL